MSRLGHASQTGNWRDDLANFHQGCMMHQAKKHENEKKLAGKIINVKKKTILHWTVLVLNDNFSILNVYFCVIQILNNNIRPISVALQLRRAKTDWSGCCQMTLQGALWLAMRLSLNLNFSFLNRIRYFLYQVATQLSSRSWVDPVSDPIPPEKFLGYSRESNPGPLG